MAFSVSFLLRYRLLKLLRLLFLLVTSFTTPLPYILFHSFLSLFPFSYELPSSHSSSTAGPSLSYSSSTGLSTSNVFLPKHISHQL